VCEVEPGQTGFVREADLACLGVYLVPVEPEPPPPPEVSPLAVEPPPPPDPEPYHPDPEPAFPRKRGKH